MMRQVLAVVVGYVVIAVMIFATFSAAYLAMGTDAALRPGSFDVTTTWIIVSFVLGFLASMVGGYVAASISPNRRVPQILAAAVLALSLAAAIPLMTSKEPPAPRSGDVPSMTAMMNARNPVWFALLIPFTGAVAVLIGAGLRRRGRERAQPEMVQPV